jgi:hypothetical protein
MAGWLVNNKFGGMLKESVVALFVCRDCGNARNLSVRMAVSVPSKHEAGMLKSVCHWEIYVRHQYLPPITVTARPKTWIVFARSNTGIVGSNVTGGMALCVYSVFVLSCVCKQRPYEGLIHRPRSTTDRVKGQETEKRPRFNKRDVEL